MSEWNEGYVTDITYTHGFYREQTPALLNLALVLRGYEPVPIDRPFNYCELGSAHGVTLNILAASNTLGQFWGTDFNPAHAVSAARLAGEAGTGNVRFFDKSFAQFLDHETPTFDFVALHGIYSWVSPENRRQIVDIIGRKLRFGGAVYISYNALPGWAAAAPLRQLMVEHAARSSEPYVQRAEKALAFVEQLKSMNAAYFAHNPALTHRIESMKKLAKSYLVHEYLNSHWTPFFFSQVAQELDVAKLSFACSAHIGDHLDSVALPAKLNQMIDSAQDPVFREIIRDYILNQQFRRDIFVKGAAPLAGPRRAALLRAFRFALTNPRADVPMEVTFPIGKCKLVPEIYEPIIETLEKGPATLNEIAGDSRLSRLDFGRVVQAVMILQIGGHVSPALPAEGEADRKRASDRLNGALMERAVFSDEVRFLASPVIGSGVAASRLDALFLRAIKTKKDLATATWDLLAPQGLKFVRDGQQLNTVEENLAEMSTRAKDFEIKRRPFFERLGVI